MPHVLSPAAPLAIVLGLLLCSTTAPAGAQPAPAAGTVEQFTLRSAALAGNLIGDSPDRSVSVYLPPSYAGSPGRRYPVVYLLHGFTDSDAKWFGRGGTHWITLPEVLDRAMRQPDVKELIVVMPDAFNAFEGSMYSSSVTIGDWERFVAEELVAEIDRRYRTLAAPASRGLAGHSMGGYGTLRIGMKHPDVYAALYALSPCCLAPPSLEASPAAGKASPAEAITSVEQIAKANFFTKAQLASAGAWSPNPGAPPLFVDLLTKDGQVRPDVAARWAANAPLAMVHQYIFNLRRLKGIAFDAGTGDKAIHATTVTLDGVLNAYKLPHVFGSYDGDHLNRVAERIERHLLPFFSTHLAF